MRPLAALMLLLFSAMTLAQQSVGSVRIDNRIISVGDSRARVLQVAGQPDHIVILENRNGGAVGQRWEYYRIGSPQAVALSVEISGGQVRAMTREILR